MSSPTDSVVVTTVVPADAITTFALFTEDVDNWWKQGPRFRGAGGTLRFESGEGARRVVHRWMPIIGSASGIDTIGRSSRVPVRIRAARSGGASMNSRTPAPSRRTSAAESGSTCHCSRDASGSFMESTSQTPYSTRRASEPGASRTSRSTARIWRAAERISRCQRQRSESARMS